MPIDTQRMARLAEAKSIKGPTGPVTLYVKHESGAMHALTGKAASKLAKEIAAGRGGPEVVKLVEAGYIGFLGKSGHVLDFEALTVDEF